jgi:hypothetical protein
MRNKNSNDGIFIFFSTMVNITYGGFTFRNYYLHRAWIFYIMQEYEI